MDDTCFKNIFFTFVDVEDVQSLALHIVKVFFASPYWKMWKFSCRKDLKDDTHFRLDFVAGHFCALISHIYSSVGYCVVYFQSGLSTTFAKINESQLHTFFLFKFHLGVR